MEITSAPSEIGGHPAKLQSKTVTIIVTVIKMIFLSLRALLCLRLRSSIAWAALKLPSRRSKTAQQRNFNARKQMPVTTCSRRWARTMATKSSMVLKHLSSSMILMCKPNHQTKKGFKLSNCCSSTFSGVAWSSGSCSSAFSSPNSTSPSSAKCGSMSSCCCDC